MPAVAHTVIRGNHFLLCNERGDVTHRTLGLFAADTRHLSTWLLTIDGALPDPLGESHGEGSIRTFVQRNVRSASLEPDSVVVTRRVLLSETCMLERLELRNVRTSAAAFELRIQARADFDDIFSVKEATFATGGDSTGAVGLPHGPHHHSEVVPVGTGTTATLRVEDDECRTTLTVSRPFELVDDALVWRVELGPAQLWSCDVRVEWSTHPLQARAVQPEEFGTCERELRARTDHWVRSCPRLESPCRALEEVWERSVRDLEALQIGSGESLLTAAGTPWFMTVFGRDSLITGLQTTVLGAERSMPVLEYLAARQADADDPLRDAEPGKILHEVRAGSIAGGGFDTYYGSLDSTPLFLVLLHEVYRWTRDEHFLRRMWPHALRALEWMDVWGDPDDDGLLEFERRSPHGLDVQSWRDSWDSQVHPHAGLATGPIAPVEVQGYAYDARVRLAALARTLGDEALAARAERDAIRVRALVNERYWTSPTEHRLARSADDVRAPGFFAMALDGEGERVASLSSNIGHLLWSGVVDDLGIEPTVRQLTGSGLHSGWGVRTLSADEAGYNPIGYHRGTVWPHDTSIAVAGLCRAGAHDHAERIARGLLDAAAHFDGRLPEVFAGIDRTDVGFPVLYPTASAPQAWAAGAFVLIVTELLGIAPAPHGHDMVVASREVGDWLDGLKLDGIRALGTTWRATVRDRRVEITER